MVFADGIISQYHAALRTLESCIDRCPNELWVTGEPVYPFWQIAYHTAFFTDLYLSADQTSFVPWARHVDHMNSLDWYREQISAGEGPTPYTRNEVSSYVSEIRATLDSRVRNADPGAESGFHWLSMSKFELQVYNIRHLQHHVGQLVDRLRNGAGVDVDWVGVDRS